jgi:hypothetical protein
MIQVPLLGELTRDDNFEEWLASDPTHVAALGTECEFVLDGYEEEPVPADFHAAIQNFLECGPDVVKAAASHVARYCRTFQDSCMLPTDEEYIHLASDADVWRYVTFGRREADMQRLGS